MAVASEHYIYYLKKLAEETKEKLRQRAIEQWKRQKEIKRKEKNERK